VLCLLFSDSYEGLATRGRDKGSLPCKEVSSRSPFAYKKYCIPIGNYFWESHLPKNQISYSCDTFDQKKIM